jgi:hypothetical protein
VGHFLLPFFMSTDLAGPKLLRSSETSARPSQQVAITAEGKIFHRADCPFIHGPVKMEDAQTAAQQGYVPDSRCMREALQE